MSFKEPGLEIFYYDNKRVELVKPIPPSKWEFTVYNQQGNVIGRGFSFGNKRAADTAARKFVLWYVDLG